MSWLSYGNRYLRIHFLIRKNINYSWLFVVVASSALREATHTSWASNRARATAGLVLLSVRGSTFPAFQLCHTTICVANSLHSWLVLCPLQAIVLFAQATTLVFSASVAQRGGQTLFYPRVAWPTRVARPCDKDERRGVVAWEWNSRSRTLGARCEIKK